MRAAAREGPPVRRAARIIIAVARVREGRGRILVGANGLEIERLGGLELLGGLETGLEASARAAIERSCKEQGLLDDQMEAMRDSAGIEQKRESEKESLAGRPASL